ncbi:glycosyltransferase family 2 protein [Halorubrum laminariae]|uniref:Glycosyltransferase family 2 protein n=1 Tax=Halorubrum laminariae TaxID=1433523 RepID=A0ABD6C2T7_9EURY|nr:glycosyltransferase family 2 protein [Halorubrum laminariae]
MYRDHTIGVVVPAYNEEGLIGNVIRTMPGFVDRIYVVDDCSTDGTLEEVLTSVKEDQREIPMLDSVVPSPADSQETQEVTADGGGMLAQRAKVHDPIGRVIPIEHRENLGAGGSIKTGYLASLQDETDVTVTMDGDGQMDPDHMPKLLDPIVDDDADYAKANRLLYREYRQEMPKFRFIGNSILTFLTKISSGYWKTMDPQNGYTAISHYALDNVGVEAMYEYYGYCNDLLVKLNTKGMRVADVAVPAKYGEEESSISYPTYIRKVSGMLLRNFLWRLKTKYLVLDFHPLAQFYIFGAVMALFGVLGGGWSVYQKVVVGNPLFVRASTSLLVFSIGSMFLMFAMLFDMQVNENKEIQVRD